MFVLMSYNYTLECDRKGFLAFHRNRNTANQKSSISPQPQVSAVRPLTAERSSCGRKTALSAEKMLFQPCRKTIISAVRASCGQKMALSAVRGLSAE